MCISNFRPGVGLDASGTAWFLRPTVVVTAAHTASGMSMCREWQPILCRHVDKGGSKEVASLNAARLMSVGSQRITPETKWPVAATMYDDIALLELQEEVPHAHMLAVEHELPPVGTRVGCVGFPHGQMALAVGEIFEYESGQPLAMRLNLGLQGIAPTVMRFGSSGAPIVGRRGRAVAVLTGLCEPDDPFELLFSLRPKPTNFAIHISLITPLLQELGLG